MSAVAKPAPTLDEIARRLAPHLDVVSVSQPTPHLRRYNVIGLADDPEAGRRAVLALEALEHADDQLGTVTMAEPSGGDRSAVPGTDPERVTGHIGPAIATGGLIAMVAGAVIIGGAALVLGAEKWEIAGAAAAGAMLMFVFGAIWATFGRLGGSDAYRQTFVDPTVNGLTLVSVHTDDEDDAAAASSALRNAELRTFRVDRNGRISEGGRAGSVDRAPADVKSQLDSDGSAGPAAGAPQVTDDATAGTEVVPGEAVPDFSAPASTGVALSLDAYLGKVPVALTFTGPLPQRSLDEFVDAAERSFPRFGEHTVQLLLVLPETEERVRARRTQGIRVPIVADAEGRLLATFAESATFPSTLVIDRAGAVTRVVEGGVAADHVEQALAASIAQGYSPT